MKGLIDLFRIILLVFATLSDQTDKPPYAPFIS